jgi:purine-nucleoside phosphorylase
MLLIFGALKIELNHIIRSTSIHKKMRINGICLYRGDYKKMEVLIVVTGMSKDNAVKAVDIVFRQEQVKKAGSIKVLITGFCGGASNRVEAGDLVAYNKVIDLSQANGAAGNKRRLELNRCKSFELPKAGGIKGASLVTCGCTDHVVSTTEEKKFLFHKYGADVIDMESYWLIEELKKKGISPEKISCIRALSDDSKERLPLYFSSETICRTIAGLVRSSFLSIFSQKERRINLHALNGIRKAKNKLDMRILENQGYF